ncbi:DinB family protein [Franzmannia qiaohouensis]|uniref:DinB family protein n=1 Tax=Franzmannia qiaohouensis TaxID=1329370 RepID=A0ABU1HBQ0_9GAMM|nr:DinB family protein [Halomonas qiaohouensis]MDR5904893.1 DinB family protein [Halomonas qiaohouensis]
MTTTESTPCTPDRALIEENQVALAQLRHLVAGLTPEAYQQAAGRQGRHTLGKHVRHIIDHVEALLNLGPEEGVIDYEHRRRDARLEQWPQQAANRLDDLEALLAAFAPQREAASLHYPVGDEALTLDTSVSRELAFLTSHTIHHMAIIGLLAEHQGIPLAEDFGVHPSTLRHWQQQAASC